MDATLVVVTWARADATGGFACFTSALDALTLSPVDRHGFVATIAQSTWDDPGQWRYTQALGRGSRWAQPSPTVTPGARASPRFHLDRPAAQGPSPVR